MAELGFKSDSCILGKALTSVFSCFSAQRKTCCRTKEKEHQPKGNTSERAWEPEGRRKRPDEMDSMPIKQESRMRWKKKKRGHGWF